MKPEVAQDEKVPVEVAAVMPVGESKKKRRRDRKLAAERRRQKPKNLTQENYETQKKLAVARRGTTHHAEVARKMQADKKMPRRATVARRMRDIFRPNTTRRAKAARQIRKNDRKVPGRPRIAWRKRSVIRRNCTRAMIERATQRVGSLKKNLRTHQKEQRANAASGRYTGERRGQPRTASRSGARESELFWEAKEH
jgi:hypothetical protein